MKANGRDKQKSVRSFCVFPKHPLNRWNNGGWNIFPLANQRLNGICRPLLREPQAFVEQPPHPALIFNKKPQRV